MNASGAAAVRAGRKFIGIEKDPQWFDVAVSRLQSAVADMPKQTIDLFAA